MLQWRLGCFWVVVATTVTGAGERFIDIMNGEGFKCLCW